MELPMVIESKVLPLVGYNVHKTSERTCVCLTEKRGSCCCASGNKEIQDDSSASFSCANTNAVLSTILPPCKKRKLDHDAQEAAVNQQQQRTEETHKRMRRRVQIHEDHTFHPPTEHSVLEEKPNLWYSQEDFTLTLMSMKKAIRSMKEGPNDCSLPIYGETLASTYLACCVDSESSVSAGIPSTITPVQLELLGTARGDHRGMETCALPHLAAERSQKRREIIQNVVLLGKTLSGFMQREEFIRSISEQLTAPSRKFAQAMGISDTLSALATYAEDSQQQTLTEG